jgi:hypothetical protein
MLMEQDVNNMRFEFEVLETSLMEISEHYQIPLDELQSIARKEEWGVEIKIDRPIINSVSSGSQFENSLGETLEYELIKLKSRMAIDQGERRVKLHPLYYLLEQALLIRTIDAVREINPNHVSAMEALKGASDIFKSLIANFDLSDGSHSIGNGKDNEDDKSESDLPKTPLRVFYAIDGGKKEVVEQE